jgi:tetraacyldisaccharide 4'-kinase
MREPLQALSRAGAVVLTRCDTVSDRQLSAMQADLKRYAPQAVFARAVHRPSAVIDNDGARQEPAALSGRRVLAVCGLGNPKAFFTTARSLGAEICRTVALGDHARYDRQRLTRLADQARDARADIILTSEKDFVKLADLPRPMPVWQLAVAMDIIDGEDALVQTLRDALGE